VAQIKKHRTIQIHGHFHTHLEAIVHTSKLHVKSHDRFAIQHSPSNREKSKHVSKVLGFGAWEWLGEKVSSHVLGRTVDELNRAIFD
jgi:hypothetical protein